MRTAAFTIVFEGGEAAGKTSQIGRLVDALREQGETIFSTGVFQTAHGALVRKWLMDGDRAKNATFRSQVFVLASAMNQMVDEISEVDATVIIIDRFVYTTMAYHGGGLRMGIEAVQEIYAPVLARFSPDLVIFLDLPPEFMLHRRRAGDRIEAQPLDFHQRVRSAYKKIFTNVPQAVTVDAQAAEDDVCTCVRSVVFERLRAHRGRELPESIRS